MLAPTALAADHLQQGVATHRQSEVPAQPHPGRPTEGEAQGKEVYGQPQGPPGRRGRETGESFGERAACACRMGAERSFSFHPCCLSVMPVVGALLSRVWGIEILGSWTGFSHTAKLKLRMQRFVEWMNLTTPSSPFLSRNTWWLATNVYAPAGFSLTGHTRFSRLALTCCVYRAHSPLADAC